MVIKLFTAAALLLIASLNLWSQGTSVPVEAAEKLYREFYTSGVAAVSPGLQWAVIAHRNAYGRNDHELLNLKTGGLRPVEAALSFQFMTDRYLVRYTKDFAEFEDLKSRSKIRHDGTFIMHLLPELKSAILYDKSKRNVGMCTAAGRITYQLAGISQITVDKKSGRVWAYGDGMWYFMDAATGTVQDIEVGKEISWSGYGQGRFIGLSRVGAELVLHQWEPAHNKRSEAVLPLPGGFVLNEGYDPLLEIREERYLLIPLVSGKRPEKEAAEISYTNRNQRYPAPLHQLAVYDLMIGRWIRVPDPGDLFKAQEAVSREGDFIEYDLAGDPVDAAGNPKHAISLLTNYGTERVTVRNMYRNPANYNYDKANGKMTYFEEGTWRTEETRSGGVVDIPTTVTAEWADSKYSGLSEEPWDRLYSTETPGVYVVSEKYDLYLWDTETHKLRRLTFGREHNVRYRIAGSGDNKRASRWDSSQFITVDLKVPVLLQVFNTYDHCSGLSWLQNGKIKPVYYGSRSVQHVWKLDDHALYSTAAYADPLEIFSTRNGNNRPIYRGKLRNGREQPALKTELLHYPARLGVKNAVLLYPVDYDPRRKYPMIVNVYEENMAASVLEPTAPDLRSTKGFNYHHYVFQGYFVLLPDLDYAIGDHAETMVKSVTAATEAALRSANIDAAKVGVTGTSFGGYETTLFMGRTDLFRTAVAGVPITDLSRMALSYFRMNNQPDYWRVEKQQSRMVSPVFESWEAYLKSSPVYYIPRVTQPILLWTGKDDTNVNPDQSRAYFLGLKRLKKPGVLLEYEKEGHVIADPQKRRDLNIKAWEWWDHFLNDRPAAQWIRAVL